MNRRNFLKALGAAGIATVVPLRAIAKELKHTFAELTHDIEHFDYGNWIGLRSTGVLGRRRVRHAVKLFTGHWDEMNPLQRKELWARLDAMVLDRLHNEETPR